MMLIKPIMLIELGRVMLLGKRIEDIVIFLIKFVKTVVFIRLRKLEIMVEIIINFKL